MDFPTVVGMLIAAGLEGYASDYHRKTAIYYLPSGESIHLHLPPDDTMVAIDFNAEAVKEAFREDQTIDASYTYEGCCRKVKAAECAGYVVSFPGRRVMYFGRTA